MALANSAAGITMEIRAAIVGVGNCSKSLLEGLAFYSNNRDSTLGLLNPRIGRYSIQDINIVAAFDVDRRKVGKPLHLAVQAEPNRTLKLAEVPASSTIVQRGPTLDSIIPELRTHFIQESDSPSVDVSRILTESRVDVVISYLPTGSVAASYAYAEAALSAGCSYINCMPAPIARDKLWRDRFASKGLVLLGDDIKSQFGATVLNRFLLRLCELRGVQLEKSDQVNYGGNADHFNLVYRGHDKEESKEFALRNSIQNQQVDPHARMVYVEANYDHKCAEITLEGRIFGGARMTVKVILNDEDSPNSAGIVVDAIRTAKLLTEVGLAAKASEVCTCFMKAPPKQLPEEEALLLFRHIISDAITRYPV
jgi:myo-inositol-1-phosphate synthase